MTDLSPEGEDDSPRFKKRYVALALFVVLGMVTVGLMVRDRYFLLDSDLKLPVQFKDYQIKPVAEAIYIKPPVLPDITGYTLENLQKKKPAPKAGEVRVQPIESLEGLEKFTEKRRLVEFGRLQSVDMPKSIHIASGVYTLETLRDALKNPAILDKSPDGVYTLKIPLYIGPGASLIIEGEAEKPAILHLSSITGAFLVTAGDLFIIHADIAGWNDKKKEYSVFQPKGERDFRPFITSWSGSHLYIASSTLRHLGYHMSKSYGLSMSSATNFVKKNPNIPRPTGWIIDNIFEGFYYGYYSYEADDVAILRNTYRDNIVYGIDPHDRSRRLIIGYNTVYGTQKKHGIIISREVDDGWIFNNLSYKNKGSGLMLDRTSVRNVVAYNRAFLNASDGLTLFESQDNIIYGNKLMFNGKSGLRIRNSWNVDSSRNWIAFNGGDGAQVYGFDIKTTELDRDYVQDPFTLRAGLRSRKDMMIGNRAGGLKINNVEEVILSDLEFGLFNPRLVRGDLDDMAREIGHGIMSEKHGLAMTYYPEGSDITSGDTFDTKAFKKGAQKKQDEFKLDDLDADESEGE